MKTLSLILSIVLLAGCATTSHMNHLSLGMTKAQVIDEMGTPKTTSAEGNVEYMNYSLYEVMGTREPYFVRLVDGKVESYGRRGDFDSTQQPKQRIEIDQKVQTSSKN